jgi:hypothetical protein
MIRTATSFLGLSTVRRSTQSVCFHRKFSSSLRTAEKTDLTWKTKEWNERLDEKALSLIFGEKRYEEFSNEERRIVDLYQQKLLKEDWVILPNTGAAIEQEEVEQMLLEREKKKLGRE